MDTPFETDRSKGRGNKGMAITPYLLYQDAGAVVGSLAKAFGLRRTGDLHKAGRVNHASMMFGGALLRRYGAEDFEGHRWYFAEQLASVERRAGKKRTAARKTAKTKRLKNALRSAAKTRARSSTRTTPRARAAHG